MVKQITTSLPRTAWASLRIQVSDQPLVSIEESQRIKLGLVKKSYECSFLVREAVCKKLINVADRLPDGINLVIIEGYRSLDHQQRSWDKRCEEVRSENKDLPQEEVERLAGLVTARPAPLANHNCGGAVDVTLAYEDGTLVDMGSPYIQEGNLEEFKKKYPMLSTEITAEQASNRKILRDAMEASLFVWYPGEWWHFCWGDRMWAVYTGRKIYYYGPVDPDKHILTKK